MFDRTIRKLSEERRYNFELQNREVLATDDAGIGGIDDLFGAHTAAARRWSDMGPRQEEQKPCSRWPMD